MTGRGKEMSDPSANAAPAFPDAEVGKQGATAGVLENACEFLCACALFLMIAMIGTEVICRSFLGFSTQMADEIGGYLLVAITFLSLSVSQSHNAYHHVEFVQQRLSPRARLISQVIFDLLSLTFCVVLSWQLIRLELASWYGEQLAPTMLGTPLWIPRMAMPIGTIVLSIALLKSLAMKVRALRSLASPHAKA